MKTLTVQEASESLSDWMRRAVRGEKIAIHEGNCAVLLQPLSQTDEKRGEELPAREALRELQSRSRISSVDAEGYLREVRDERIAGGSRPRQ